MYMHVLFNYAGDLRRGGGGLGGTNHFDHNDVACQLIGTMLSGATTKRKHFLLYQYLLSIIPLKVPYTHIESYWFYNISIKRGDS